MLSLLCPKEYANSVLEINLDSLREKGISLLLFDLDNTLVEWHKSEASPEISQWFQQVKEKGFNLCILSNNCKERVAKVSQILDVPFICKAVKPRKTAFCKAMETFSCKPEETGVIGDQIFTDILGGNRLGLYTILVTPLTPKDFWGTKVINRRLEKIVLKRLRHKGLLKDSQTEEG